MAQPYSNSSLEAEYGARKSNISESLKNWTGSLWGPPARGFNFFFNNDRADFELAILHRVFFIGHLRWQPVAQYIKALWVHFWGWRKLLWTFQCTRSPLGTRGWPGGPGFWPKISHFDQKSEKIRSPRWNAKDSIIGDLISLKPLYHY